MHGPSPSTRPRISGIWRGQRAPSASRLRCGRRIGKPKRRPLLGPGPGRRQPGLPPRGDRRRGRGRVLPDRYPRTVKFTRTLAVDLYREVHRPARGPRPPLRRRARRRDSGRMKRPTQVGRGQGDENLNDRTQERAPAKGTCPPIEVGSARRGQPRLIRATSCPVAQPTICRETGPARQVAPGSLAAVPGAARSVAGHGARPRGAVARRRGRNQSWRKARIGSTRVARAAGSQQARAPMATIRMGTAMKVVGSRVSTP